MKSDLPNDATGDALRRLSQTGSDLGKPLEMDFFVAAPSERAAQRIAELAVVLGFATEVEFNDEHGDWTCVCSKTIVPSYDVVAGIEKDLHRIAVSFEGYCDGFGSFGNS